MRKTTADRLLEIMKERNLRQVDIINLCQPYSEKFGIKLNKSDLSQYLNRKTVPAQFKLTILALALNVSETWLMGYDVPKNREEQVVLKPTGKRAEIIKTIETMNDEEFEQFSLILESFQNILKTK